MGGEKQGIKIVFRGYRELQNQKESVIKYFLWLGSEDIKELFPPYVWGKDSFGYYTEPILSQTSYGNDLRLLLIKYFVVGVFTPNDLPSRPILSNYSNKNKDITVDFAVTREKFHNVGERERREFIVNTTLQAIDMVEGRLGKRKLDIDFENLRRDVKKAAEDYLKQPNNLA
nr:hypothetical protein [candidate division Zixibacteria bacterium]